MYRQIIDTLNQFLNYIHIPGTPLNPDAFQGILVKKLSNQNIIKDKRRINAGDTSSTVNQTHIDVTGKQGMLFFFEELNNATTSVQSIDIDIYDNVFRYLHEIDRSTSRSDANGNTYFVRSTSSLSQHLTDSDFVLHSSAYKKYRRHKILFITELIILIPLLVFGFLYVQFEKRLGNIDTVNIQSGDIQVNEEVENNAVLHGYTNIALFGVDSRDGSMDYTNTDTIIIASINNDTKVVKLVSIYRDTYLNIGEDRYGKANAAYANGGYKWAINMLNQNLDLDITDFVTVNMNALVEVVDALGGFDFDLTDEEVVHMNNYCVGTSEITGKSYERIEPEVAGTYHLNGVQAVSYSRIRYTAGNDYKRTERQRELIAKIVAKAKKADMKTLVDIMDNVFPMISTSLSKSDIVSLGMNMLSYQLGDTCGFPFEHRTSDLSGDSEVPVTLSWNVTRLHDYLFGIKDYEPSAGVQERSAHIEEVSGFSKGSAVSKENYTLNGEEAGKDVDDNIPGIQETESETETQTQEAAVSDNGDGSVYDDNSYDQEQYNDYSPDGYNYDEEY